MKVNLVPEQKEKVQEPLSGIKGSYDAQVDTIKKFVKALRKELKEAQVKFHIYRSAKVELYRKASDLSAETAEVIEEKESELLEIIKRVEALLQRAISELAIVMEGEEGEAEEAIKELESELKDLEAEYSEMKEDVAEEISDTQKLLEELRSEFEETGLEEVGEEELPSLSEEGAGEEGSEGGEATEEGGAGEGAEEGEEGINVLNPGAVTINAGEGKGASADNKGVKQADPLEVYKDAAIKSVEDNNALAPNTKSSLIDAITSCTSKECVDEVLQFFNLTPPGVSASVSVDEGGDKNMKKAEVLTEKKNTVDAEFLSADTTYDVDAPASRDWAENNSQDAEQLLNSFADQDRGPLFDDPEVKKFIKQFTAAVLAAKHDSTGGPAKVATALLAHPIGAKAAEYMIKLAKNSTRILYASAIAGVMKGMVDNPLVDAIKSEIKAVSDAFGIDFPEELADAVAKNASVKALESFVDAVSDTYKRFASLSKKAGTADALLDIVKQVKDYEAEVYVFGEDDGTGTGTIKSASLNPNVVVPSDVDTDQNDFLSKLEAVLKERK